MHELSIALSIVDAAADEAARNGAARVTAATSRFVTAN
jgi:Zn finger protein HypA/HybF involved in hydrogenase expression